MYKRNLSSNHSQTPNCPEQNSAGGRCYDNALCESIWARMKTKPLYNRYHTEQMISEQLKTLIWRYFINYWNNHRICSANEGLPPMWKAPPREYGIGSIVHRRFQEWLAAGSFERKFKNGNIKKRLEAL